LSRLQVNHTVLAVQQPRIGIQFLWRHGTKHRFSQFYHRLDSIPVLTDKGKLGELFLGSLAMSVERLLEY